MSAFQDAQDYSHHAMELREPIDLNDLKRDQECTFEVTDGNADNGEFESYFDQEKLFSETSTIALGLNDVSDSVDPDLTPFQIEARTMVKVTEDGGIMKKVLKEGVGEVVPSGAFCQVHYNIYLEYADEPHDSTRLRNQIFRVRLGKGYILEGFEKALETMKKGEQARFIIGPEYNLGVYGCPPRVPPNASAMYEIEMLEFTDRLSAEDYFYRTHEEKMEAPFSDCLRACKVEKEEGNSLVKKERYDLALKHYKKAVRALEDFHLKDESDEKLQQKELLKLYLNIALCDIKICHPKEAIRFCNEALRIDTKCVKAMYRTAQALRQIGEFERAKNKLLKAQRLSPQDGDICREMRLLDTKMQRYAVSEKKLL